MGNDGSSPSKQYYNDVWSWVEWFKESQNRDDWGFADIDIEYEIWYVDQSNYNLIRECDLYIEQN